MPIQNWATRDLLDALMTKVSKKTFKTVKDLDVIEERLQKITAILRGRRNALASINRLPTELLENIFELVQLHLHIFIPSPPTASGYDHGYRGWLVLLAVCRHWRGIAATSGVLWSSVDTSFMPQRFLKRSKDSLLSVYCGIRRRPAPKAELQLIQPHLHRCADPASS
ncbi:hypothetical protein CYLTODRAFT_417158 [Cylindrobasidium torrendii FP15055 ss-10]|uniref:F-box domain-containing protein n=1 Tax=Cylindrobasidium torrendii FP15055 ss-10 TaxID=1314674 RepID=A0A0D7BSH3_9AGAR|nr:hypothetical protein CYLTODRAFT_417158 [Cylindrobasidium torrendii FP15055 ss-10]